MPVILLCLMISNKKCLFCLLISNKSIIFAHVFIYSIYGEGMQKWVYSYGIYGITFQSLQEGLPPLHQTK